MAMATAITMKNPTDSKPVPMRNAYLPYRLYRPYRQRGAALLIALLMLVVLLMIGISAMHIGLLTEKMGRNQRDRQIARLAAEAGLLDAQYDVGDPASPRFAQFSALLSQPALQRAITCNANGRYAGICLAAAINGVQPAWKRMPSSSQAPIESPYITYGRFSRRSMQTGYGMLPARLPRYVIEILPSSDSTKSNSKSNSKPGITPARQRVRISALGYGPDTHTQVLLQSIYLQPVSGDAPDLTVTGRLSWRELANWDAA
jgi:type IV pilus assembly protein PilX